jgi:DNA-binding MarR family transcriptional regulator
MSNAAPSESAASAGDAQHGLPNGGPALFRLVRFWSRRWINRASQYVAGELRHVHHILVVEAVGTAEAGDATVASVAHQLGLDHSGASRMVRDATAAGYLTRATSSHDRRRAALELTERGRDLLDGSHRWQRAAFDQLTADWDERDRRQLTAYLQRLAHQLDLG